jgi:large subunit ribosomal protein L32
VAVPKRRKSASKRNMRRAQHDKVEAPNIVGCPSCHAPMISHRACPACGFYNGRAILKAPAKTS